VLVLTLKYGERVMIGEDVEVMLVSIRGGQARLGIVAPREVEIDRAIVRERKTAERALQASAAEGRPT